MPVININEILCIFFIKENHAKAKWYFMSSSLSLFSFFFLSLLQNEMNWLCFMN